MQALAMSFGSDQPPTNFDFDSAQNPYASTSHPGAIPPDQSGKLTQLSIAGAFILAMSGLMLFFVLLGIAGILLGVNPNAAPPNMPKAQQTGFMIGQIGSQVAMLLFQCVAIAGSVCMILRKGYGVAVAGAIVSLVPLCGPCFGLSIPFAIWALILLLRPEVKSAFS